MIIKPESNFENSLPKPDEYGDAFESFENMATLEK